MMLINNKESCCIKIKITSCSIMQVMGTYTLEKEITTKSSLDESDPSSRNVLAVTEKE